MKQQSDSKHMNINKGDVYWVALDESNWVKQNNKHPHVVIQENVFNHSDKNTIDVCLLTTNTKQTNLPGNVLLEIGEANLDKRSVVVVSRVSSINKSQLGQYIGSLSEQRIRQVLAGISFLQEIMGQSK